MKDSCKEIFVLTRKGLPVIGSDRDGSRPPAEGAPQTCIRQEPDNDPSQCRLVSVWDDHPVHTV
jgi:hypothetical protein